MPLGAGNKQDLVENRLVILIARGMMILGTPIIVGLLSWVGTSLIDLKMNDRTTIEAVKDIRDKVSDLKDRVVRLEQDHFR